MRVHRLVVAIGLLCAGPAQAAPSAWLMEETRNFHPVTGPFISIDDGFRIDPPPGSTEYATNGGAADHGPILILGEGREMVVYPQYTGFTPGDDKPCEGARPIWKMASRTTSAVAHLGDRNACMRTFIKGTAVERILQATGNDRGTGIMYTLMLTTTLRHLAADSRSFDRLAGSFRRVPIRP